MVFVLSQVTGNCMNTCEHLGQVFQCTEEMVELVLPGHPAISLSVLAMYVSEQLKYSSHRL